MSWISAPHRKVGSIFFPEEEAFFIPALVPNSLYQVTCASGTPSASGASVKAYFETTNNGIIPNVDGVHAVELYALYSLIGLTWKQLASLFGVDVRLVHYWIDGKRTMAQEHADVLNKLTLFASKKKIPSFRFRKVFEEHVLSNASIISRIQNGDWSVFVELDRHILPSAWISQPVSDQFLRSRLPTDSPVTLMSSGAELETKPRSTKSRSVRVSRPKKT